jgi:AbrB family looped-hinge helix DNA binding protein
MIVLVLEWSTDMGHITTLSSKGQITIPQEVRDELGLKPDDKIEIVVDGAGTARLRKAGPSLEDLMGSLPLGIPVEEAIERAKAERAEHYLRVFEALG